MTVYDRYLLATAASLALVGGAAAADLPTRKAAPTAEYVRVCTAFGAGYFVIPGSDTCLKIGGVARYEINYRSNAPTNYPTQFAYNLAGQTYPRNSEYDRSRAYINLDARSETAYGPLSAILSLRFTNDSLPPGPFGGGKIAAGNPAGKASAGAFQGLSSSQTYIDAAYIQWAGITAGRTHSFFDFYTHNYEIQSLTVGVSDQPIDLLAYSFAAGGFKATLSAEATEERQIGDSLNDTSSASAPSAPKAAYLTYGGTRAPDVVAALRYDGDWGSAQIAGAMHNVTAAQSALMTAQPTSKWGYAVDAGLKFKLDAISKGDSLTMQATSESGAMDYVNAVNYYNGTSGVYSGGKLNVGVPVNDAFILPNYKIALNTATGGFVGYQHVWSPQWRSALFGSYLQINNPAAAQLIGAGADNARIWDVGVNTIWSPAKGLDIGAEVVYTALNLSGGATLTATPPAISVPNNNSDIRARLRLQYSF